MWSDGAPVVRTSTAVQSRSLPDALLPQELCFLHSRLSPEPLLPLSLSPWALAALQNSCQSNQTQTPTPPHPGCPQALPPVSSGHSFWYLWGLSSPLSVLPLPSSMKTGTLGSLTATSCLGRTAWSWCGMTRDSGVMCPATTTSPTPARWGLVRADRGRLVGAATYKRRAKLPRRARQGVPQKSPSGCTPDCGRVMLYIGLLRNSDFFCQLWPLISFPSSFCEPSATNQAPSF